MDHYRALLEELRKVDAFDRDDRRFGKSLRGPLLREVKARPAADFGALLKGLEAMHAEADADLRASRHADLQRRFAACSAHFDEAIKSGRITAIQAAKVESLMARLAAEAGLS